ncbi:hypothetical protein CPB84DRAFT_1849481 [Gymnopilus junonius]|uniref:Uncharacterized protein n=1 Tax=Gymnopilus junonius TaxID=109634 RepID=A0A9P5TKX4_GYMJU|nr:hypothetical protein CPB84DRAFT_1849481 [Gymnopilus junonius]
MEYQHLSPDLAAKVAQLAQMPAPTSMTHEELFSLVSAYVMIERIYQYSKPDTTILPSKIILKQLEKLMVDTFKIPYFEKLYDILTLLHQIRQDAVNMLASTQMALTLGQDSIIVHHLKVVSYHQVRGDLGNILDNFCLAGFNLAVKLQGNISSTGHLPNLPDKKADYDEYVKASVLSSDEAYRVNRFISKIKPNQLHMSLDMGEPLSPICMLVPYALRGVHGCSREGLLKVCTALSNDKPPALWALEARTWQALVEVATLGKDVKLALQGLMTLEAWKNFEDLPSSDPTASPEPGVEQDDLMATEK